jgi:hypothetical protein
VHEEGDGEVGWDLTVGAVVHTRPVEESAGELTGGGGVEGEAASGEDSAVVFASDGEGGGAADVGVGFHHAKIVSAGNGLNYAGGDGFGADAMEGALVQGSEAENVAGASDAEKEEAAFAGGGGDLDATVADDVEVFGGKALAEEDDVCIALAADANGIEVTESVRGEVAEGLGAENGAV